MPVADDRETAPNDPADGREAEFGPSAPQDSDQAHRAFGHRTSETSDDSGQRFRDAHPEDTFSGASGVLFEQAMAQTRMAICLTDPQQEDAPIEFANRAFRELTGYADEEIIGRNCRFLQGPDTDPAAVARTLHELATNAIKHGALSDEDGRVEVEAIRTSAEADRGEEADLSHLVVRWRERGGPSVSPPEGTRGAGTGIVDTLLRAARGELVRDWQPEGLEATVRLRIGDGDVAPSSRDRRSEGQERMPT